jgi:hypothetical protein
MKERFAILVWLLANLIVLVVLRITYLDPKAALDVVTVSSMLEKSAMLSKPVACGIAAVVLVAGFHLVIVLVLVPLAVTVFWMKERDVTRTRIASTVKIAELLMPGQLEAFAYSVVTEYSTKVNSAIPHNLDVPVTANFAKTVGNQFSMMLRILLAFAIPFPAQTLPPMMMRVNVHVRKNNFSIL